MSEVKGSEPVYPCDAEIGNTFKTWIGITKREYFAGLAMQGYARLDVPPMTCAALSVEFADALLAELEKTNG